MAPGPPALPPRRQHFTLQPAGAAFLRLTRQSADYGLPELPPRFTPNVQTHAQYVSQEFLILGRQRAEMDRIQGHNHPCLKKKMWKKYHLIEGAQLFPFLV